MLKNSVAIVFLATLVVAASVAANDVNSGNYNELLERCTIVVLSFADCDS